MPINSPTFPSFIVYTQNQRGKSWGVWMVRDCWIICIAFILSKNNFVILNRKHWLKNLHFTWQRLTCTGNCNVQYINLTKYREPFIKESSMWLDVPCKKQNRNLTTHREHNLHRGLFFSFFFPFLWKYFPIRIWTWNFLHLYQKFIFLLNACPQTFK